MRAVLVSRLKKNGERFEDIVSCDLMADEDDGAAYYSVTTKKGTKYEVSIVVR